MRSTTPRWALAHKFPANAHGPGEAIDIGSDAPARSARRAAAPVTVGGVVVSNATLQRGLHRRAQRDGQEIRGGKDIRIGDWVEIYRAGDVIPKVADVDLAKRPATSQPYAFPVICPECCSAIGTRAIRCGAARAV